MAIAPIPSYTVPQVEEVCKNIAPWRASPRRAALLIHDMQRYFLHPFDRAGPPSRELHHHVAALRAAAHELGMPVFYTMQKGSPTEAERGLLRDFWGMGMRADPAERSIAEGLEPNEADHVLTKWRYSAFHRTGLHARLRELGRDQLVICGVYAHLGCLITAYDAFSHDIETFLAADAVADFSAQHHAMALANAAAGCAVVSATTDLLDQLRRRPGHHSPE